MPSQSFLLIMTEKIIIKVRRKKVVEKSESRAAMVLAGAEMRRGSPVRYADGYLIVYLDRQQEVQRRIGYTGMSGCFTSKIYSQKTDEPYAHHTRTNLLVLAIYTKILLTFGHYYDSIDAVIKVLAFLGVLW